MFVSSKILLGSALLVPCALASSACTTWNNSTAGGGGSAGALSSVGGAAAAGAPISAGAASSSAGAASGSAGDTTYGGAPNSASALLAPTPPMGWNSWNKFACDVSENLMKQAADAMASSGMKDAGYQYVVIDDCWQVARDEQGGIVADAKRFPSGMKSLGDYIHSKGLKFGI
jgi:hypothetical protein